MPSCAQIPPNDLLVLERAWWLATSGTPAKTMEAYRIAAPVLQSRHMALPDIPHILLEAGWRICQIHGGREPIHG